MPKPLVIGTELVTVAVSDEERRIIDQWAKDHHESLREALDGTGLKPEDILLPEWRRVVYENDEEVVQAAIDSGLARGSAPTASDSLSQPSGGAPEQKATLNGEHGSPIRTNGSQ